MHPDRVAGLDRLLHGGLFRGSSYLVVGPPGAGKTIFANQMAFQHVATGGRVVYLTLVTEPHDQILAQLRAHLFDPAPIGQALLYLSGSTTLVDEGLSGLRTLVRTAVRIVPPC